MFTEKDLKAGETVLVRKIDNRRALYLGNAGLVHFVSNKIDFECANNNNFRIQELNQFFTIEQPKSKVVPMEKKVYDFVPVRCNDYEDLVNCYLIAVYPSSSFPYKVITDNGDSDGFEYCEFINEQ